ncbi:hypothetical protein D3C73_1552750 [compost metagenome]
MESRNQRCALPAPGHVATAEIADGSDTGHGGDTVVIPQLHRERHFAFWLMPDGLSVTANRRHLFRGNSGAFQQPEDRFTE